MIYKCYKPFGSGRGCNLPHAGNAQCPCFWGWVQWGKSHPPPKTWAMPFRRACFIYVPDIMLHIHTRWYRTQSSRKKRTMVKSRFLKWNRWHTHKYIDANETDGLYTYINQTSLKCATARPSVIDSEGPSSIIKRPNIRCFVAKPFLSQFTRSLEVESPYFLSIDKIFYR